MSLFSSIGKLVKKGLGAVSGVAQKIAPYASIIPGPTGTIGKVLTIASGIATGAAVLKGSQGMSVVQSGLPMLPGAGVLRKALPAVGRALPGIIGAGKSLVQSGGLARIGKAAARAAGYIVSGYYIYDAAGNLVGQTARRRMNPMNYRALTRACRRVKSAKKILKKVERLTGTHHRAPPRAAPKRKC